MKNGGAPEPCETFTGGEVEDYTVSFGSGTQQLKKASINQQLAEKNNDIRIYPNPAGQQLILEMDNNALGDFYRIYDLQGRKMINQVITSKRTSIEKNYVPGIYLLVVTSQDETFYKKFVKK